MRWVVAILLAVALPAVAQHKPWYVGTQGTGAGTWTPPGNSDAFTGSSGTALATHDSNWASLDSTYVVGNLELDGSGNVRSTGDWVYGGAYYAASSADTSQIILKAMGTSGNNSYRGPIVRWASGGYYYYVTIFNSGGANYSVCDLYRMDAGTPTWLASGSFTGAVSSDYTVKITASGSGATVTVAVDVGGTNYINHGDSTAGRLTAPGHPGFFVNTDGAQNNSLFDNWTDTP